MNLIPKTLYSYWGGQPLSFLRYLTLYSFHKYNPDWDIVLYSDECVDLSELDFVEVRELPGDVKLLCEGMAPAHISDVLRLYVLHKFGGIWSDMDVLFVKPVKLKYEFLCFHKYYSIGFMGAAKGNPYFKTLFDLVSRFMDVFYDKDKYQCLGSRLMGKTANPKFEFINIPKNLVYPFEWYDLKQIFIENHTLPTNTIGIHWYGGSDVAKAWEKKITKDNYEFDNTMCSYIKGVIAGV